MKCHSLTMVATSRHDEVEQVFSIATERQDCGLGSSQYGGDVSGLKEEPSRGIADSVEHGVGLRCAANDRRGRGMGRSQYGGELRLSRVSWSKGFEQA